MANILVVDEDDLIRNIVAVTLEKAGHKVAESASEDNAMELIEKDIYDIIVTHLKPPQPENVSMFKALEDALPHAEVIIMTEDIVAEEAVEAMKLGVWSYVVKPVSLQQITMSVNRALEKRQLASSIKNLRKQVIDRYKLENIVARSKEMQGVLKLTSEASRNNNPVMITGENGTGKHLIGKTIHITSPRTREPFIYVDLDAVDNEDIESMLFGSVSSPVSGTTRNLRGAIERADRGTIFLRETTIVPIGIQERLLEFLNYNTISRQGSDEIIYVDARLIAVSSADVEESVRSGAFRDDLLHELRKNWIHLPPLKERRDDIPPLADHFISKYSQQFEKQIAGVSKEALSSLISYNWPGNVRELENAIERALALASEEVILPWDLPHLVQNSGLQPT